MITPGGEREWYNRVPSGKNGIQDYVIEDDEEDELAPQ